MQHVRAQSRQNERFTLTSSFDLALKDRLLPKNKAMSQLSESNGGKLKTSNCRKQNNCIEKCAGFHKPCNPVRSHQPQQ